MRDLDFVAQSCARLLAGMWLGLWIASASAVTLPFHDPFDYAEGNLYSVASGVWTAGGNTGPELSITAAATLTAPAGLSEGAGKGARWTPSGTARRSMVQFDPVSSGTLYASFLVNVVSPPSSTRLVAYFDSSTSQPSSPQLGFFVGNGVVGVGKQASAPAATATVGSGTHFIVVRYTFTGTATDQVDFWVDPAATTLGAATTPAVSGSTSGGNNAATIPYFGIYASSAAGPSLYLDEMRIATNWAGVTPTNGPALPPRRPVVTNAWLDSDVFVMQGTNGQANTEYGVLAATNPAQPADQWTLLARDSFDSKGHFATTNPLDGSPQRFFRLQVGNLPVLPVAPVITNQPQDRVAGEGQSTTFTVGASGTLPLSYQWYFNTNTLLAGKTTATLSLSALQTNQSGGYSVIVTNVAGAATSLVASLTITSMPPTAPSVTTQPKSQTVSEGQTATFTVLATGTPPLIYQWYFNTDTILPSATTRALTLEAVTTNDAGGYSVVVTNSVGAQTSVVAQLTVLPAPTNGTFYVATNGNDTNAGTLAAPLRTLPQAVALAGPGAVIYLRGGTHFYSSTIRIEKSGTPTAPIRLWAYPGEMPVLNFTNQPYGAANRGVLITTTGNWWEFKGLEICYAGDNAVKVEGSHHRFEQCVFHHNGDTGLQIGFGHEDANPGGLLAAFIEVVNCDSYLNYDPDSNGGDADGFAAKMHCGQGILFTGCRAWENSDDGWDLFETDYSIVISNCWTWKSGVAQGNGNGFKLGGNGSGGDSKGTHYAYHCVAFGHKVNGFTQNSHKDGLVVINSLSFSNGSSGYNYFMEGSLNSGKQNVFKNNASIPRSGANGGGFIEDNNPVQQNNSWNLAVTVNAADYVDLGEAAAKAARNPDGRLPQGFARLVTGSDLIDTGIDVGIPFTGAAPDLGPYEAAP